MKRLNLIGKIVIAIGILSIFRTVNGGNGFGGYIDNAWEIIIVSIFITITGIFLVYISKKRKN